MRTADKWTDYELLDASDGQRLERYGNVIMIRPDPQVIWHGRKNHPLWKKPDGVYTRSETGGGAWTKNTMPASWNVGYGELKFLIRPMNFKHTGLFPEQAVNWDKCSEIIKAANRPVNVLNLFAYTGAATIAAAKSGAEVVHVDAAKGIVTQAKENAKLSGLADAKIRYIVDDCKKFVQREIRRENKYDGIIMDPPSYGRGPGGEVWKLEDSIDELVALVCQLLSDNALFFLLNSYTTGLSASAMGYLLGVNVPASLGGAVEADEIGLPVTQTGLVLPCGATAGWYSGKN